MSSNVQSPCDLQEVADKIDLCATAALEAVVGKVELLSPDAAAHLRLALSRLTSPGQSIGGALRARHAVRNGLAALGDASGLEKEVAAAERAVRDAAIPRTQMRCPLRDREAFVKVLESEFEAIVDEVSQEEALQELPRLLHAYRKVSTEWFREGAFVSKGEQEAALSGRPRRQPKPSKSARAGAGQLRAASSSAAGLDRLVKGGSVEDPFEGKDTPGGDGKWQNEATAAAAPVAAGPAATLDGRWTDGEGRFYTISGNQLWCGERCTADWDGAVTELTCRGGAGCAARLLGGGGTWWGSLTPDGGSLAWQFPVTNGVAVCIFMRTWVRVREPGPTR